MIPPPTYPRHPHRLQAAGRHLRDRTRPRSSGSIKSTKAHHGGSHEGCISARRLTLCRSWLVEWTLRDGEDRKRQRGDAPPAALPEQGEALCDRLGQGFKGIGESGMEEEDAVVEGVSYRSHGGLQTSRSPLKGRYPLGASWLCSLTGSGPNFTPTGPARIFQGPAL